MKQLTNVLSRSWPDMPGGLWIQSESDFDPHSCRKEELQCDYIDKVLQVDKEILQQEARTSYVPSSSDDHNPWDLIYFDWIFESLINSEKRQFCSLVLQFFIYGRHHTS